MVGGGKAADRAYREGRLGDIPGFVPATIVLEQPEKGTGTGCRRIEIVMANGRRVIVDCDVDVETLLRIMQLFCFRGRRGDLLKVIWHDGQGACLFTKRLERGRFLWPSVADGAVTISSAQLGYLLSGIDWRHPQETWRPTSAG